MRVFNPWGFAKAHNDPVEFLRLKRPTSLEHSRIDMLNKEVWEWRFRWREWLGNSSPRWFRYLAIGLLIMGIFFRFYNIDKKVYWVDEAYTTLRMTGHTKTEVIQEVFTGQVVDVATLQSYQRLQPDKGWDDTLHALKGNAEHTPLYFLMARAWTELFGYSIAGMRVLPALISLLVFPALGWLCWELFESAAVSWMAIALVAISPLHVLYAQEARPYTLWTLMTVLSSAALLWAMRSQQRQRWLVYGATVAVGLYSQLLFGLVTIAHAVYVALLERLNEKRQLSQNSISYLLAAGAGFLAFTPWLVVLITNFEKVRGATVSLTKPETFPRLVREWLVTLSRLFLDRDLKSFNIILVLLVAFALYYLCRHTPKRVWLFILALVGVPFLALAIPDLISGGQRSSRLRYLFPCYIGIQIAMAYLLVSLAVWSRGWQQKVGKLLLVVLVVGGILGSAVNVQAEVWWNKSETRSGYYPVAAKTINEANKPLIISDGPVADTIAFSYRLQPQVKFQLVTEPKDLTVAPGFNSMFLLNPSEDLRTLMASQQYIVEPVPGTRSKSRRVLYNLWTCRK